METRVRLYGVDAPEKRQPFGSEAKRALSDRIFGKVVRLEETGRDRYGRMIGKVYLGARCINDEMVRDGMAWWYDEYAPHDSQLSTSEHMARGERIGVWSAQQPEAPWEWRKSKRASPTQ